MNISNVTIVGGTHGNELTGVYLVKHLKNNPELLNKYQLDIQFLLANELAIEKNIRYLDQDLNRQFADELLSLDLNYRESKRAREIHQLIGAASDNQTDLIIDLHTTTTNMGLTLVITMDSEFHRQLVAYIQQTLPEVNIFFEPRDQGSDSFLMSIAKHSGIIIEVGPIAQGTLKQQAYDQTKDAVFACLDFIEKYNQKIKIELPESISVYEFIKKVPFNVDARGDITGMIHKDFECSDYRQLKNGDPIFSLFSGDVVEFKSEDDQDEKLTACFINEAAYYDKKFAFSLMREIKLEIPK
ncbi:MAG: aspartoacylase [Saccharospirillaceae bacterium]|nr:aspartoacylase [Pseudomonadales bacterium]NRB79356.1 aspartoacylase [Saccharospirillaceae bacterium]